MSVRTPADDIINPVLCPVCRRSLLFYDEKTRIEVDPITDKETETIYRELECLDCGYHGEYVPWRETSQGNASSVSLLPLTSPPPRSNSALILDASRLVLASEPSLGVAVFRAQSFEHAEYIVWCTGSVLRRVRTAQGERHLYLHVWDSAKWSEFFADVKDTTQQT